MSEKRDRVNLTVRALLTIATLVTVASAPAIAAAESPRAPAASSTGSPTSADPAEPSRICVWVSTSPPGVGVYEECGSSTGGSSVAGMGIVYVEG